MRVRLLGRPAIAGNEGPVELRGPRQAGLLALLGTEVGRIVRTSRIEDELWHGHRVSESAVRVNVNRLRARFLSLTGDDPIVSHTLGYSLDLAPAEVDIHQFVVDARAAASHRAAGRPAAAIERADAAERWWRGPAFEGVTDVASVRPEHDRLESLRSDLWQERASALIELDSLDAALDQLDELLAAAPYRETAWGLRLYALARSGRRDEAVARYRELADLLRRDLAIGPDPVIEALATAIRAGDTDPAIARRLLGPVRLGAGSGDEPGRAAPVPRTRAGHPGTPFVGRAELLDDIAELMLADGRGPGAIAIVEGPPGIGKTRLAGELTERVREAGGTVLAGTCPREGGSSIAPVADILGGALALAPPDAEVGLAPLAALVPAPFGGPVATGDPDPDIRRLQLFDAATLALARLGRAPLLVVVDDLQWLSTDSARFLHHLVERTDARWLLLARSGERTTAAVELLADVGRWHPTWHALEPLAASDVALLVQQLAPDAPTGFEATVVERSGGNPFYAHELVRHLVSGGEGATVPPGITQLVRAGLGRLEPRTRQVAEVLAIARDPLPLAALPVACDLDPDTVDAALVALISAGLAARTDDEASLAHDLVTESVDATVGPGRRRVLHTAIGRALAGRGLGHQPATLVHLLQGQADVAGDELDRAAAGALHHLNESAAYHETIRIGAEYLDAVADAPLTNSGLAARVQLAAALLTAGPYGRGVALLDRIEPDIRRQGDARLSAEAILARGTVNVANPELVVKVDEARLVLDALDPALASARVQLACWIAHHLALLGRAAEARSVLDRADADTRFDPDPDPALLGLVLGVRLQVASGVETPPAAFRDGYAELCAFVDEFPILSVEAWQRLFALDQAARDGTLDDHGAAIDALDEILVRYPRPDLRWTVQAARAGHALARGELDRAEQLIVAAQVVGGELSVGSAAAVWVTQLFMLQYERGDMAVMTPFLSSLAENSSSYQLAARALLHIESGDTSRARDMAVQLGARDAVLATAGAGWAAIAAQVGDIAFATGERRLAESIIGELGPHQGTALSAHGLMHLGAADRTLGLAWATLDDLDRAIDHLERAHTDDRRRGVLRWAARAARAEAVVRRTRRRRGDVNAARVLDQEAGRLLTA